MHALTIKGYAYCSQDNTNSNGVLHTMNKCTSNINQYSYKTMQTCPYSLLCMPYLIPITQRHFSVMPCRFSHVCLLIICSPKSNILSQRITIKLKYMYLSEKILKNACYFLGSFIKNYQHIAEYGAQSMIKGTQGFNIYIIS